MAYDGSYPSSPGNKPWSIHEPVGPTSYAVIVPGSPPTGGQSIPASSFGLQSIEAVLCTMEFSGTYEVRAFLSPPNRGQGAPNILLQWVTAATGAEVAATTNLSAIRVRIMALGY